MSRIANPLSASSRLAARTAVRIALAVFVLLLVIDGIKGKPDWYEIAFMSVLFGIAYFLGVFLWSFSTLREGRIFDGIMARSAQTHPLAKQWHPEGFVAMEYRALFLNRSFLIFVLPDGLYGWKFEGAVGTGDSEFFNPIAALLKDPAFTVTREGLTELSARMGNFYIPRKKISFVEFSEKQKWGLGQIPHSGILKVGLSNGRSREFILLGNVSGETTRDLVLHGPTTAGTSKKATVASSR